MNAAERFRRARVLTGMILLALTALTVTVTILLYACGQGMYDAFIARPDVAPEDSPLTGKTFSGERLAWRELYMEEQWTIRTADGLTLVSEYTRPPEEREDSHAWVLLASGIHGRELYLEDMVIDLHRRGCHVLSVHLRAHGASEGDALGLGYRDKTDILSWVRRVETADPEAKIVLYGFSSAAAAMLMAAPEAPPSVTGIVSDSAFTRFDQELNYLLRERYGLPVFPLTLAGNLACYRAQGFWFGDADAKTALETARVPILFFHGGADDYVPPEMAGELYEAAPGNPPLEGSSAGDKTLLIVPGASHCRARDSDPDAYWALLNSFLTWRLRLDAESP